MGFLISSLGLTALEVEGTFLLFNVPVRASKEATLRGLAKFRPNLISNFCFLASRFSSSNFLKSKIHLVPITYYTKRKNEFKML